LLNVLDQEIVERQVKYYVDRLVPGTSSNLVRLINIINNAIKKVKEDKDLINYLIDLREGIVDLFKVYNKEGLKKLLDFLLNIIVQIQKPIDNKIQIKEITDVITFVGGFLKGLKFLTI